MESERDQVCTWCGKSLAQAEPEAAAAPGEAAPAVAPERLEDDPSAPGGPGAAAKAHGPAAPGGGRHAGAARAMFQAEAAKQQAPVWRSYAIGGGILLVLIIAAQVAALLLATRPPAASAEWKQLATANHLFSMQAPAGWEFSTSGSLGTYEQASLKAGGRYSLRLRGTQVLGAMADISGAGARLGAGLSGMSGGQLPLEKRKEGQLHALIGGREQADDSNYKEEGEMQAMTIGGLPAAYSDYTTKQSVGLLSVEMKGRRITIPATDVAYDVRVTCPAGHWNEFEPVAMKVIHSLTRGAAK